ncbi:MAG: hypothetical protein Q4F03_04775 [Eubacteriales bacterium]|nr:hypothetical protein [Eubacteriales bacterium]
MICLKNKILKTLAFLNFLSFLCMMASEVTFLSFTIAFLNLAFLFLMAYANGWVYGTDRYYEREGKR